MFLLCGAALSALAVHAQKKVIIEDESPKGVVLVTIDKAGDEIIRIMNESQMPYIHEPQAPRFLLTDRKREVRPGHRRLCTRHGRVRLRRHRRQHRLYPCLHPQREQNQKPVSNGCQHVHHFPETGRAYQDSRRLRGVHRRQLPRRFQTKASNCAMPTCLSAT